MLTATVKPIAAKAGVSMESFQSNAEKIIQTKGLERAMAEAIDFYIRKEEKIKREVRECFTSKFGKDEGQEKYLIVRPYLEGKEDITDKVEEILNLFNYTHYTLWGVGNAVPVVSNHIKYKLKTLEIHRRVFLEKIENAYLDFGDI